ncbi:hypothetical protein [uncultured Tateyamaria sp.]|uniref:hypothetical protein n=1 Tax=uncultured Tateyamaria sp. TaxID=455651 RepID=UPI002620C2B6|nr:hypothetical protein [uncultured Tateyamaria sp.]
MRHIDPSYFLVIKPPPCMVFAKRRGEKSAGHGRKLMSLPMQLDAAITERLIAVIREKFDLDAASTIEVQSIEVDAEEHKIIIALSITTNARPEALARSYLGLTGRVREVLGSDWSGFFPVITPQIHSGAHA